MRRFMDEEILAVFRSNKDIYISGEDLSKRLNISRAAIWKHIKKLKTQGYEIIAYPHWGYKLISTPDALLPAELKWNLSTNFIGSQIYSYRMVESTNDIAYDLASKGAKEGTVITAEGQTRGKGRMGRNWISPPGKGIYISFVLRPQILPQETPKITLLASVACAEAIRAQTGLLALIRWPNDVLVNEKKVCGILTEMNAELDRVNFLILGIGINVNADLKDLPLQAGSLAQLSGKEISRLELTRELLRQLEHFYLLFKESSDFTEILKSWERLSAVNGRRVNVICQERKVEGLVTGIDESGALILRLDNGLQERILAGDVVLLR
jgi:BirA family biotin operon repressor/biotin-[acetyl-CoA-carboxylase] ligase